MVQLSHHYMTTSKNIALTIQTFVSKVMSLLFNMLSRLVIAFLPRSKCLLISWLQSLSAVILESRVNIYSLDVLLSNLEPVHCSTSSFNCCFWTWKQISQEAGKVFWYSHLLKNFPQFVVIHTVKGVSTVNEEIDVFLELFRFFNDPMDVGNLTLVPLPFLNSPWTSGSSQFTYVEA